VEELYSGRREWSETAWRPPRPPVAEGRRGRAGSRDEGRAWPVRGRDRTLERYGARSRRTHGIPFRNATGSGSNVSTSQRSIGFRFMTFPIQICRTRYQRVIYNHKTRLYGLILSMLVSPFASLAAQERPSPWWHGDAVSQQGVGSDATERRNLGRDHTGIYADHAALERASHAKGGDTVERAETALRPSRTWG
jgi:hypothetical protein